MDHGRDDQKQSTHEDGRTTGHTWFWGETLEGIGGARHLARLCEQQHAYRWLCGGVAVDQATLRSFRGEPGGATDRLLASSLAALVKGA